jgi:hypothetical protein
MTKSNFILVDSMMFLLIGLAHLVRALMGWEVTIGTYVVPVWFSWLAILIALYLGFQGFMLSKKT